MIYVFYLLFVFINFKKLANFTVNKLIFFYKYNKISKKIFQIKDKFLHK